MDKKTAKKSKKETEKQNESKPEIAVSGEIPVVNDKGKDKMMDTPNKEEVENDMLAEEMMVELQKPVTTELDQMSQNTDVGETVNALIM